jgi:hypothetical protein
MIHSYYLLKRTDYALLLILLGFLVYYPTGKIWYHSPKFETC